jgi:hypothetical protein
MIQHVFSVLCMRAVIDRESNNLSLFEVIERLTAPAGNNEGLLNIQVDLVSVWSRSNLVEACRGRARMRIQSPDGTALGDAVIYDVDLTAFVRARNTIRFGALPFKGTGYHFFIIEKETEEDNWQEVGKLPLELALEQPLAEQPAAGQ